MGEEYYLVARNGSRSINVGKTADNKRDSLVTRECVYLMKEIAQDAAGWNEFFTREEIVTVEDAPVLVTTEGLLLVETVEVKNKETIYTYTYALKENAEGKKCRILVNNAGEEIGLVPVDQNTAAGN